jgi:ferredoxin-NADP reductase
VTAIQLLTYITAALLLQVIAGMVFVVWRRLTTLGASPSVSVGPSIPAVTGAWSGWRDFRIIRREFEDVGQTQCSFYLQPVDGVLLTPF